MVIYFLVRVRRRSLDFIKGVTLLLPPLPPPVPARRHCKHNGPGSHSKCQFEVSNVSPEAHGELHCNLGTRGPETYRKVHSNLGTHGHGVSRGSSSSGWAHTGPNTCQKKCDINRMMTLQNTRNRCHTNKARIDTK